MIGSTWDHLRQQNRAEVLDSTSRMRDHALGISVQSSYSSRALRDRVLRLASSYVHAIRAIEESQPIRHGESLYDLIMEDQDFVDEVGYFDEEPGHEYNGGLDLS